MKTTSCTRKNAQSVQTGWPRIIAEAEAALVRTKARERELKRAIKTMRLKIQAGEEFPLRDYKWEA